MNLLKNLSQSLKFLVVTLLFSLFLFSQSAIAAMGMSDIDSILKSIQIKGGEFSVDVTLPIKSKARIGSAVVVLPEGETGIIEEIAITGPDGKIFGCVNQNVQNGTDLIDSCGGFAYLVPGDTTYQARGRNFKPQPDVEFSVELFKTK